MLLGRQANDWQDSDAVLRRFGARKNRARERESAQVSTKPIWVVMSIKSEFDLKVEEKAVVAEQSSATKKVIMPYLSTDSQKNEKSNLSKKELIVLKEFAKVLLGLSDEQIQIALQAGDFIEVTP